MVQRLCGCPASEMEGVPTRGCSASAIETRIFIDRWRLRRYSPFLAVRRNMRAALLGGVIFNRRNCCGQYLPPNSKEKKVLYDALKSLL